MVRPVKTLKFPDNYWGTAADVVDRYLDGRTVTTPDGARHRGRTDGAVMVYIGDRLAYRAYGVDHVVTTEDA